MPTPVNIGLIGVGRHARQVLIPAIEQLPDDLRLVALATAHADTARAAEDLYRLPCSVGPDALLADPQVEAVIVASSGDHEAHALAALTAGKHVFCETPGITSDDGAARIRDASAARRLTYLVASCLRFSPLYQAMRRKLAEWRREEPGPRMISAAYYFTGGHLHNLMLYLDGAVTHVLTAAAEGGGMLTLLRFANGDIGCLRGCSFNNWSIPYERVEIAHPSGLLVAEEGRLLRFQHTPAERSTHPMEMTFDVSDGRVSQAPYSLPYGDVRQLAMRGYILELREFADCVRTGAAPTCGVDDALATLRLDRAVRRSLQTGGDWEQV